MKAQTTHVWIWGWLRLAMGHAQMWLALAAFCSLLVLGFEPQTWILAAAATLATLLSRVLYHGKR
jgi:hypothetical protein